jgi:hypothetical protein
MTLARRYSCNNTMQKKHKCCDFRLGLMFMVGCKNTEFSFVKGSVAPV